MPRMTGKGEAPMNAKRLCIQHAGRLIGLFLSALAVTSCLLVIAAPSATAGTITYDIQAYIDSRDELVFRGTTMQWHHKEGAAPGRHGGANEPTIISSTLNGVPLLDDVNWIPSWPEPPPAEIRYEAWSSVFGGLMPPFPVVDVSIGLSLIEGLDEVTIEQAPAASNNWTLILEFRDWYPGPSWYHIELTLESLTGFWDIALDHWAREEITACVGADIVHGYPDGTYAPTWSVSRAQMAVFISRALAGGDENVPDGPAEATFDDVPTDHWAYKYVEYCVANDIVQGFDPVTYGPAVAVSRDAMAVFIARAVAGDDDSVPDGPAEATFDDVPTDHWAYKYVEYCVAEEIVHGYDPVTYGPTITVSRDQMAVFISRAFNLL